MRNLSTTCYSRIAWFASAIVFTASMGIDASAANEETGRSDPSLAPVVYAAEYMWQRQQSNNQQDINSGVNSIDASPCPKGVNGTDKWHYIFIFGTGTPEAVLISGGTCISGANRGTLQFSARYTHSSGYSIGSATAGLQEAVNEAILPSSNGQAARSVLINPGQYSLQSRVSVRASGIHISGYGATVNCAASDTCIMLGDPSNSNMFSRIILEGLSVRPGVPNGTFSAIEDNANGSQLKSIAPAQGINPGYRFGHIIQIDNDQAASIERFDMGGTATIRCDSQFCGSAIFAPGPFATNAGVGWISNSNINPQCAGNGVDWQSGNTVQISNTVIEGYAQYGVRAGVARGGYGSLKLDNVYEEVGNCHNPAGNIGLAGVVAQGGDVRISGGEGPSGLQPCFSHACSGQLTRYYVIANNFRYGSSNPMAVGVTSTNDVSTLVSWPSIAGATSYDLLVEDRVAAWYAGSAPSGEGQFAVATNIFQSSCTGSVCNYMDAHKSRLKYTIHAPTYFPLLTYWPGSIILGSGGDTGSQWAASVLYTDAAPAGIIGEQGSTRTAVFSSSCSSESAVSPIWIQCQESNAPPTALYQRQATIMLVKPSNDGGLAINLKGRINFGTLGSAPSHIITLSDSNFGKTIATANNRPTSDPGDAFIGYDRSDGTPAHIGVSLGAPASLSEYIGNAGDGTNWAERLTSSLKTFRVPVQTTPVVFSALPTCNPSTEGEMRAVLDSTANGWGAMITGHGSNHVLAYCDGTNWTVAAK